MVFPFLLLILLLCAAPAMAFFDPPIAHGLIAGTTALATALVGIGMPPGEGAHVERVIRPWAVVALVPALWMAVQALPLPSLLSDFAHPIWSSAAGALDRSFAWSISIDPGMTLVALGRYLTALGIVLVVTAVTIERAFARSTLLILTVVTAVAAILLVSGEVGILAATSMTVAVLRTMTALGAVLSLAAAFHAFERHQTQRYHAVPGGRAPAISAGACLVSCIFCGLALHSASAPIVLATTCGAGLVLLIAAFRWLGAGPWATVTIFFASVVAISIVVLSATQGGGDLAIRFAVPGSAAASARIMADVAAGGNGAGTFSAVLPIYGSVGDIADHAPPPTIAAAMIIELGRPVWVLIMFAALVLAASMLRYAIMRGRDWQYPAASVGAIVLIMIESFADSTLLNSGVMIIAAATVGVGLSQSLSRTIQ